MRLWMHGIGEDIPAAVRKLKSLGFEAVVGSNPGLIEAASAVGLDVYLCSGAYGASGTFSETQYLAQDINGKAQLWFNSTCPNQPAVRSANLASIAAMAQTSGVKGILIDGARFASPASSPDLDAFYTCFCPVCLAKAEQLGFDAPAMKTAVKALYRALHGDPSDSLLAHAQGIADWFTFRRQCTTEHLHQFSQTVKGENPYLLTGIYIFTPALAPLVGQNYLDLHDTIDILAPMIYRHYPAQEGPACLNHEISALVKELSRSAFSSQNAVKFLSALTNLPLDGYVTSDDILQGLPPAAVGSEVRHANSMRSPNQQLIPIIQLDDPLLGESIQAVKSSGANGVNFFVYQEEWLDKHTDLFETLVVPSQG